VPRLSCVSPMRGVLQIGHGLGHGLGHEMNETRCAREATLLDLRDRHTRSYRIVACLVLGVSLSACRELRESAAPAPAYEPEISQLLRSRCVRCHDEDDAGSGFRLDSYLGTLACPKDQPGTLAVERGDAGVPILEVLNRTDHARLLDSEQEARLRAWVNRGAPLRDHGVHAPGILNPRSRDWHGRLAARDGFGPIKRASHPDACGRCHAGAPVAPAEARTPAPGATACTTCHVSPGAVLACGTCHGDGAGRAYPPRDTCAFPGAVPDAHRAHLEPSSISAGMNLRCSTCHPTADAALSGKHANGKLDLMFDPELAGSDARYDPVTGICAVRCHQRGGALELPRFDEPGPLVCGSCHQTPPADHYAGACVDCHRDLDVTGTALTRTDLHLNGRVDLGDATGGCGACHGQGADPMPRTASHALHRDTTLTTPVTCNECHPVPEHVTSAGHLDRGATDAADISFGARAQAHGQTPSYVQRTCREIACHGAGLPDGFERALVWDAEPASQCAGCHGLPPAGDHPREDRCATVICHGTEVSVTTNGPGVITDLGRMLHINGQVDTTQRLASP
jgi:predicted CxxxxCH...CXXCH cytochrome family protein